MSGTLIRKAKGKKQAAQTVADKFRHVYGLIAVLGKITETELDTLRLILQNAVDEQGALGARIEALEQAAAKKPKRWWEVFG